MGSGMARKARLNEDGVTSNQALSILSRPLRFVPALAMGGLRLDILANAASADAVNGLRPRLRRRGRERLPMSRRGLRNPSGCGRGVG